MRLTACLLHVLVAGAAAAEVPPLPAPDQPTLAVAAGMDAFGCELYGQLRTAPGNLFISPFSIHTALDMTMAGAAGATAAEFATVLHALPDQAAHHAAAGALSRRHAAATAYELAVANRLFARQGETFAPSFLAICREAYAAPPEQVVFPEPGRSRINSWVAEQTRNRITGLIPANGVDGNTVLVLVNAICFKGTWERAFDRASTSSGPFAVATGHTVTAPFMLRTDAMPMSRLEGAAMVEMPYAGGEVAMDLIIPDAVDGLAGVEARLTPAMLRAAWAGFQPTRIELALPRFSLRWGTQSLNPALQALGLRLAFASGDFSRLGMQGVQISDVFHQAFVAVDEEGTVAAAATAVVVMRAAAVPPLRIRADHPFLFLIRDLHTGAILFLGRLADPG